MPCTVKCSIILLYRCPITQSIYIFRKFSVIKDIFIDNNIRCQNYIHIYIFITLLIHFIGKPVKLTGISDNVSSIKREISALEDEHVALLTAYERTFDLATVKAAAEAAGMSKPSSGQIQYIDLSGADSVEVYAAGGAAALNGFTEKAESLWAYVLEYFR